MGQTVTRAEMERTIKAVEACGLPISECRLEGGAFKVITAPEEKIEHIGKNQNLKSFEDE